MADHRSHDSKLCGHERVGWLKKKSQGLFPRWQRRFARISADDLILLHKPAAVYARRYKISCARAVNHEEIVVSTSVRAPRILVRREGVCDLILEPRIVGSCASLFTKLLKKLLCSLDGATRLAGRLGASAALCCNDGAGRVAPSGRILRRRRGRRIRHVPVQAPGGPCRPRKH